MNGLRTGYQPRTTTVQSNTGDLLTDSHDILRRRKNYFGQLFGVHGINNVKQTKIHAAKEPVPKPSSFESKTVKKSIMVKFGQNRSKHALKHCILSCRSSLILYGIRKKCERRGGHLLL
jgi:hypothetical protein